VGKCEGTIVERKAPRRGDNLYGWNSLFRPLRQDKTFAEMGEAERNKISHEEEALRKLEKYLEANADELSKSLANESPNTSKTKATFLQAELLLRDTNL